MEGFRGLASAWVFIGHICILVQCNIPILGNPSYGVDLFVLLSGFLMTKNYIERRNIEPWNKLSTVNNFWVRRFFSNSTIVLCIASHSHFTWSIYWQYEGYHIRVLSKYCYRSGSLY